MHRLRVLRILLGLFSQRLIIIESNFVVTSKLRLTINKYLRIKLEKLGSKLNKDRSYKTLIIIRILIKIWNGQLLREKGIQFCFNGNIICSGKSSISN